MADAVIAWRFGGSPALPAYLCLGTVGAALGVLDATTRRVSNVLVLPSYPVSVLLLAVAAVIEQQWWPLERAGIGMIVLLVFFLGLAVAFPGQLGFGDVKASGLVGLCLGWLGWPSLVTGLLAGWSLAALFVLGRRVWPGRHRSSVPLVPFLFAGALIAIVAT